MAIPDHADHTTVTPQLEQPGVVSTCVAGASVRAAPYADVINHAEQASREVFHPAPSPPLGNKSIATPDPDPPLAAPLSPSPSQSSFIPLFVEPPKSQPALPGFHHSATASGPLAGAEADSDNDSSDDDSSVAVGSASFVDGLDAMGVVHSATNGATGRRRRPSEFFGPSSTVSLLGDAISAISANRQKVSWYRSSPSSGWDSGVGDPHYYAASAPGRAEKQHTPTHCHDDSNKSKASPSGLRYTIPTRVEADQLIDSYWTWAHSLYPFLHMPSFLERYRAVWESAKERQPGSHNAAAHRPTPTNYYDGMSEKLYHCMLNLVFAMGALFNPSVAFQDRSSVSWTFFARGKALVDLDELACGSPVLVQVLLLMGQYLQSTDAASSCWNIVGLAIRVCQGIGLHREPECCRGDICTGGHHSQLEREIRRRTWTCSIILDR